MFQQLIDSISNEIANNRQFTENNLRTLRNRLRDVLTHDEFKIECIERSLTLFENTPLGKWLAPAIYHSTEHNFSIRLIYWPAFYENNPHKHKTWGITGVFDNKLDIYTYNLLENPTRLQQTWNISAGAGEVGFLQKNCIHKIKNPHSSDATSIHIFNNLPNVSDSADNAVWYPSPRKDNLAEDLAERTLVTWCNLLSNIKSEASISALQRIHQLGNINIKFRVIQALSKKDPELQLKYWKSLESVILVDQPIHTD